MDRHGFIHDMLDVKVLILYVMEQLLYPVTAQEIYELCYQDDCLSYFDVKQAIPQMVNSGHLACTEENKYEITDKGKETSELTQDAVAYPVRQRVNRAVAKFNRKQRRENFVRTEVIRRDGGEYSVCLGLDDEQGNLMTLELFAPNAEQAKVLAKAYTQKAESLYQMVLTELIDT